MADLDQFLRESYELLPPLPEARQEYRVYFDDQGQLLFYSMEDLPGNYVVVDREFFAGSPTNVRLRNGKLVVITSATSSKLVPAVDGVSCDLRDVAVISNGIPCQKWIKRDYD
jgi:hypothetical protein